MQRISSETAAWKLFRPSLFRRSLPATFSLTRIFFRRRADRFRQKIVEIGAILAIFESFEVRKFRMPLFSEFGRSSRDLCHYGGYNAVNLGTIC